MSAVISTWTRRWLAPYQRSDSPTTNTLATWCIRSLLDRDRHHKLALTADRRNPHPIIRVDTCFGCRHLLWHAGPQSRGPNFTIEQLFGVGGGT